MSVILANLLSSFEKNKDNPFLQYGIGIEYRNAGNIEKALEFFEGVHKSFPDYIPNYYHLAQALGTQGRIAESKEICRQGIAVAGEKGDDHAVSELQRALDLISS